MRRLFATGSEPAIREIRLAWWQERLAALRPGQVPAEPLLEALSPMCTSDAVRARLAAVPEAWRELLTGQPWTIEATEAHARLRGRALIYLGTQVLMSGSDEPMLLAGEGLAMFELTTLARDAAERDRFLSGSRVRFETAGRFTWPRPSRPLGMIAEQVRADARHGRIVREGSPARVARMAWHAMTGR